ncbi:hypothetical protein HYH03_017231 [Edaphochlamys debaryana]|uniref:Uncharacterized protein n=1 Tax=Edaphochlamys debaryana TaxID=47281 RepID=A0A836BPB5_9CHLO|nr:hypothetical protein HYH03_017231 [Edaphochlamys debaryana]|eukprot:KAG2483910.1 hypothetical protein HYH03_017231 [Edaphochlamys debaryana]
MLMQAIEEEAVDGSPSAAARKRGWRARSRIMAVGAFMVLAEQRRKLEEECLSLPGGSAGSAGGAAPQNRQQQLEDEILEAAASLTATPLNTSRSEGGGVPGPGAAGSEPRPGADAEGEGEGGGAKPLRIRSAHSRSNPAAASRAHSRSFNLPSPFKKAEEDIEDDVVKFLEEAAAAKAKEAKVAEADEAELEAFLHNRN